MGDSQKDLARTEGAGGHAGYRGTRRVFGAPGRADSATRRRRWPKLVATTVGLVLLLFAMGLRSGEVALFLLLSMVVWRVLRDH